jgi:hypothetical protein
VHGLSVVTPVHIQARGLFCRKHDMATSAGLLKRSAAEMEAGGSGGGDDALWSASFTVRRCLMAQHDDRSHAIPCSNALTSGLHPCATSHTVRAACPCWSVRHARAVWSADASRVNVHVLRHLAACRPTPMLTHAPVPQWRIENFTTLTSELVRSDCFEAGICTWWVGGTQQADIAMCNASGDARQDCPAWWPHPCVLAGLAAGT